MSKPNKLPKEVYVYWNEDKDCDPFLLVYDASRNLIQKINENGSTSYYTYDRR